MNFIAIGGIIVIFLVVFLVTRDLVIWYFKINKIEKHLGDIVELLADLRNITKFK